MTKPLTVGFIADGISGPGSGAWQRLQTIIQLLVQKHIEVVVALSSSTQVHYLEQQGCRTIRVVESRALTRPLKRKQLVGCLVHEHECDVIHLETPPFIAHNAGVPVTATIHDLRHFLNSDKWWRSREGIYQRVLEKRHVRCMDKVITVSQWSKNEIIKHLGIDADDVIVVPNVVTVPTIPQQIRTDSGVEDLGSFVLALGHLEPRKNLEVLLEAQALGAWPTETRIVIAGQDQGSGTALQALATRLNSTVSFLGHVDDDTKHWLMKGALCVAVPSVLEGFGIVAVEAMSVGTPVLLADSSALREVVPDGFPLLPPRNPLAWAEAVNTLATHGVDRGDIQLATEDVRYRFGGNSASDRLLELYRDLGLSLVGN